jgi:hypothetical protein
MPSFKKTQLSIGENLLTYVCRYMKPGDQALSITLKFYFKKQGETESFVCSWQECLVVSWQGKALLFCVFKLGVPSTAQNHGFSLVYQEALRHICHNENSLFTYLQVYSLAIT